MARRAVVFGSNGPEDAGALRYAMEDARRIAAALKHPRCGFDVVAPPILTTRKKSRSALGRSRNVASLTTPSWCFFPVMALSRELV